MLGGLGTEALPLMVVFGLVLPICDARDLFLLVGWCLRFPCLCLCLLVLGGLGTEALLSVAVFIGRL